MGLRLLLVVAATQAYEWVGVFELEDQHVYTWTAAKVDGASGLKQFRDITLPLLRPSLLVALMLATIRSVQAFDIPFVLNGGGPGTKNLFVVQYIYNVGFSTDVRNFGLASTASIIVATTH